MAKWIKMDNKTKLKQYKESEKIIRGKVYQYSILFSIEYEDLLGQANLLFCEAIERFDVQKNIKFSTFFFPYITKKLKQYAIKEIKNKSTKINSTYEKAFIDDCFFNIDFFNGLSEDAQIVVSLIQNHIEKLKDEKLKNKNITQRSIRKFLRLNYNWTNRKIEKIFTEISCNL
jgi:hypothetical protein